MQVRDVLAVDLAEAMLERLCAIHGCGRRLGNEPAVQPWLGDVESIPAYQVQGRPRACFVLPAGPVTCLMSVPAYQVPGRPRTCPTRVSAAL